MPIGSSRWEVWNLEGDKLFYLQYAGCLSFVYVVVIPGIFFFVLFRAKRSDDGFDSIERQSFGWFLNRYTDNRWWCEFPQLLRKTLMVVRSITTEQACNRASDLYILTVDSIVLIGCLL